MTVTVTTRGISPRGNPVDILTRPMTSDLSVVASTFGIWGGEPNDEYDLADLRVRGTFLDVGAHIGTIALAVLADNPRARAICVEPIAENADLIRANAALNGFTDRLEVIEGGFGPGKSVAVPYDYGEDRDNRWVGGLSMYADSARASALVATIDLASLGPIEAAKLDCEGCEWTLFADPALVAIPTVFGEWHGHPLKTPADGMDLIRAVFGATHDLHINDAGGIGLFRAVAR